MSIINESELSCSVQMRLSWDSELANSFLSYPSLYRVFIEYKKEEKDRQVEILKYPYELLVTIVEAIKTVRLIGKLDSLHSQTIAFAKIFFWHGAAKNVFLQNDCDAPLLKLLYQFQSLSNGSVSEEGIRRSCYREALFLLICAVGQGNIDIALFDAYWNKAHQRLPDHAVALKAKNDQTPSQRTFNVRQKFGELPLLS